MSSTATQTTPAATGEPFRSIPSQVRAWAHRTPDKVAMREKRFGIWQSITWAEYWDQSELVANALMALGMQPGDRVSVHSENRPEWMYADVGIVAARCITVGFYPTNPTAEVAYLLADSGARVHIAEDQEQVDKVLEIPRDELPELEHIVYIEPRGVANYEDDRLMSWREFLSRGSEHRAARANAVDLSLASMQPDDIVTLIYTSGTTGPPKGAMLSAKNVQFGSEVFTSDDGFLGRAPQPEDIYLSYLPLCHIAERQFGEYFNAVAGTTVHFAESIDTVQQNLAEVQPTVFFAVPRIWEKLKAAVEIKMASASRLKRLNYKIWMDVAAWIGRELVKNEGNHTPQTRLAYAVGYLFLYRSLRDRLGLRKVVSAGSGAAPIAPELLEWFFGIGVIIREGYGMTENAAVTTTNPSGAIKLGTVGAPYPGIEVRIDENTGEIQTKHDAVFVGYWNKPDKTQETFTEDGWLRTGDVGEWVDGTHIKIVDRMKDIIITAGGKNISPSEIENSLKTSPFIREAIVIGDKQPYLVALIGIENDVVGEWAQRRQIPYTTYRDLSEKPEVLKLIQGIVRDTNEKFARVENIRKFRMITKELDHEDGEMTATQKVKRSAIADIFGELVDDMYGNRTAFAGGDQANVHSPQGVGAEGAA